jgi:uncharacterized membrane protein YiaA
MESFSREDYEAKDKVFYSALISAWINTRVERDKQLLGLSATAIGLLVTLLRTVGVLNLLQLWFYGVALFTFLVSIFSIMCILSKNAEHIENLLDHSEAESKTLISLDKIALISFVTGMILIVIIGIHSAFINLTEKGTSMSSNISRKDPHVVERSLNGFGKLRPQPPKDASANSSTTSESNTSGSNGSGNKSESNSSS